jgi:uncharacterized NAD(P)/FAD-binding protein YdhS
VTVAAKIDRSAPTTATRRVAVVGGGASGTLVALNLLRTDDGVRVTIFEPTGRVGLGVAYGTADDRHLLNVRAGNMSALPDVPSDLLDWARVSGTTFLPRRQYGAYLRDRLAALAGERLSIVTERVVDIAPAGGGFLVHEGSGAATRFDSVVLAHGNQAPGRLAVGGRGLPEAGWHIADPWQPWLDGLAPAATVVLVGTGLTAIDVAVSVLDGRPERRVVMASRHGLLPRPHIDCQSVAWVTPLPEGPLTADGLAALFREQVEAAAAHGVDWQHVVDGLRGPTQSIWARLPLPERRRFLERYARPWEVRRHRMAPEVAARLDSYRTAGRLRVVAGGITGLRETSSYPLVTVGGEEITAHAVVNCTGPLTDVTRSDNPLLIALLRRGLIAPDELRLGLACTPRGEVLDAAGRVVPGLLTVGPPRKGTLFETTAIPEIRVQAVEVAGMVAARRRRS